jgi:hypothetical protein
VKIIMHIFQASQPGSSSLPFHIYFMVSLLGPSYPPFRLVQKGLCLLFRNWPIIHTFQGKWLEGSMVKEHITLAEFSSEQPVWRLHHRSKPSVQLHLWGLHVHHQTVPCFFRMKHILHTDWRYRGWGKQKSHQEVATGTRASWALCRHSIRMLTMFPLNCTQLHSNCCTPMYESVSHAFGADEYSVCYGPFSKITVPPRGCPSNPIAAQMTLWLAHLHPYLRGKFDADISVVQHRRMKTHFSGLSA